MTSNSQIPEFIRQIRGQSLPLPPDERDEPYIVEYGIKELLIVCFTSAAVGFFGATVIAMVLK